MNFLKHIAILVFSLCALIIVAQDDCVTGRYTSVMFNSITKTTVQYGKNININTTDSLDLLMDIYTPNDDNVTLRPAIILAHGGSFLAGRREDMEALCTQYALQGYVTASISYHLWPLTSGFPDSLELLDVVVKAVGDMKGAVRFFKADQAGPNVWKVDSTRIIIGGYSAGAITALHASHMDTSDTNLPVFIKNAIDDNGGIEGRANKLTNTSDVLATVNLSGALYDRSFIDMSDPPFISYHGNADATVPFRRDLANGIITMEGSALLHEKATSIGLSNRLDSVDGGGHTNIYVTSGAFAANLAAFFVNANTFLGSKVCPQLISNRRELELKVDMTLFPNPATDILYLRFEEAITDIRATIHDVTGKVYYQKRHFQTDQFEINIASLTNGLYIVQLQDPDGRSAYRKFMVIHPE